MISSRSLDPPRWGRQQSIKFARSHVEEWLRSIPRANGTKSKIRSTMSSLSQPRNSLGVHGQEPDHRSGPRLRRTPKRERERSPDLLEVEEFQRLQAELKVRERILVWIDMTSGLRRGELAGLRWRTSSSRNWRSWRSARWLTRWLATSRPKLRAADPDRSVYRGGLALLVSDHEVQPTRGLRLRDECSAGRQETAQATGLVVEGDVVPHPTGGQRLDITKRIGWHTFRRTYTTLLHANGET